MGTVAANDKYSDVVEVALRRSRLVPAFVALATSASLVLLLVTPLPLQAALLAATALACLALDALRRAAPPARMVLDRDGAIAVDGIAGAVSAGSFVAPWLAIVRWRPAGARFDRSLLLAPDMLAEADFRTLRVLLRGQTTWSASSPPKADQVV